MQQNPWDKSRRSGRPWLWLWWDLSRVDGWLQQCREGRMCCLSLSPACNRELYLLEALIYVLQNKDRKKERERERRHTRFEYPTKSQPIFFIYIMIAWAESSTFLYTIGRYSASSASENPSLWIIFICLTMVLFPDSPEPMKLFSPTVKKDMKGVYQGVGSCILVWNVSSGPRSLCLSGRSVLFLRDLLWIHSCPWCVVV